MSTPGEWFRRARYLLNRGREEDALRQEMEAHREMMRPPAGFGNTLRLREEARDVWGWRWLDDLLQDVRYAARSEEHTSELQSLAYLVCRLLLEKKKKTNTRAFST